MFKKKIVELFLSPLLTFSKDNLTDMSLPENKINFLLFWNRESLGFLVSNRTFFRIIKDFVPNSKITLVVSNDKLAFAMQPKIYHLLGLKNEDEIISQKGLIKKRKESFDFAVLPSLKRFSFINHLFLLFSKAKKRVGFSKINDKTNPYSFLLDCTVNFNWKDNPDIHFSEILINLLLPLGFQLEHKSPNLKFYEINDSEKEKLLNFYGVKPGAKIIGINNNSEDLLNKWDVENVIRLIELFNQSGEYFFYFTGNTLDNNISLLLKNSQHSIPLINGKNHLELTNLIAASNLFITSDSEIMHIAGSTTVLQVSIFGKRNPFNWAPLGKNKLFMSKSDGVNDIKAEEVYELAVNLLMRENE